MPVTYSARPVTVQLGERTYNASFRESDGVVHVDSAYGSLSRPAGTREARAVAEALLDEIVARSRH